MQFNKFDEFMAALIEYTNPKEQGPQKGFSHMAKEVFYDSQRFYVPDAAYIIEGKVFDSVLQGMMNLPYDNVSVLSETHIIDTNEQTWKVTLAINPNGESRTSKLFKSILDQRFGADRNQRGWVVCSFLQSDSFRKIRPRTNGFIPMPIAYAYVSFPEHREGYEIQILEAAHHGLSNENIAFELNEDIGSIQNLCAMLSLKNVETADVVPPKNLSRKRSKRGNRPLYSYHILNVDGELWDGETNRGNTGNGIRSHYRRGHIRRLSGDRSVWVRATMVKGAVPGFVDKDYCVTNKHTNRVLNNG